MHAGCQLCGEECGEALRGMVLWNLHTEATVDIDTKNTKQSAQPICREGGICRHKACGCGPLFGEDWCDDLSSRSQTSHEVPPTVSDSLAAFGQFARGPAEIVR